MSARTRIGAWLSALAGLVVACGGSPEEPQGDDCIPNQQIACSCPGGGLGVQECAADGTGYGACTGCQASAEGCSSEPDCDGCTSCYDSCACQGGDAKACLKQCSGSSSGGASAGGGGASGAAGGSGGYSGGAGGSGGYSSGGSGGSGVLDCQSCVAQSCGSELSGCSQTSGCLELVQCAEQNGCALSDYGCLLLGCGTYLINFKAVPPAMSLGGCAAQACAVECA